MVMLPWQPSKSHMQLTTRTLVFSCCISIKLLINHVFNNSCYICYSFIIRQFILHNYLTDWIYKKASNSVLTSTEVKLYKRYS